MNCITRICLVYHGLFMSALEWGESLGAVYFHGYTRGGLIKCKHNFKETQLALGGHNRFWVMTATFAPIPICTLMQISLTCVSQDQLFSQHKDFYFRKSELNLIYSRFAFFLIFLTIFSLGPKTWNHLCHFCLTKCHYMPYLIYP